MSRYIRSAAIDIASRARERLARLYRETDRYQERLSRELEFVQTAGLTADISAVAEIVDYAQSLDIRVGPGRGCSPSSLLLHLLGITHVDPVSNGLLAERWFSNPRIEVEVDWYRRSELIDYLWHRYGEEHTGYIRAYQQDKGAGGLRAQSTDQACFAISNERLADIMPTREHSDGRLIIDAGVDQVEDEGIGIVSILGMKQLSVITEAEQRVRNTDPNFSIGDIPNDEAATLDLFRAGDTDDVFQFDSEAMKELLVQAKPSTRADLLALTASFRPPLLTMGITKGMAGRIRAKSDGNRRSDHHRLPEDTFGEIEAVRAITAETRGLLMFQEQLIQIVQHFTGWTLAASESYRRRAKSRSRNDDLYADFDRALHEHSPMTKAQVADLHGLIDRSRYTYLKSHAVSYLQIAWTMAYLKTHYRDSFERAVAAVFPETEAVE
jgi:DNA polymerase III alpha subunit